MDNFKKLGSPIKSCNVLDPNINEIYTNFIYFKFKLYDVRIFVAKNKYKIQIQGFESEVSFAINIKDDICLINKPCHNQFIKNI